MKILIILFVSTIFLSTHPSPGCMDNSWHLERPFDTKEYHIVTRDIGTSQTYCPCACRKLSLIRGQCLECGHKHDVQPWIIVRREKAR